MSLTFPFYKIADPKINHTNLEGKGAKSVLIVVSVHDFGEAQVNLLTKILSAIKLDIGADCFVLKIETGENVSVPTFIKETEVKHILSFGVTWKQLGYNMQNRVYNLTSFSNMNFLLAHPLTKLENDPKHKKMLWTAIQQISI